MEKCLISNKLQFLRVALSFGVIFTLIPQQIKAKSYATEIPVPLSCQLVTFVSCDVTYSQEIPKLVIPQAVQTQNSPITPKVIQVVVQPKIVQISSPQTVNVPLILAHIRYCESGGNYSNDDTGHNGHYGAYQFSLGTWASVGGSGNPAFASPAEQDARALKLYQERGTEPWLASEACWSRL